MLVPRKPIDSFARENGCHEQYKRFAVARLLSFVRRQGFFKVITISDKAAKDAKKKLFFASWCLCVRASFDFGKAQCSQIAYNGISES
jgi:hypothetical protein